MIKQFFCIFSLTLAVGLEVIDQAASDPQSTYLILNMLNTPDLMPKRFRTTNDVYQIPSPNEPTRKGLDRLRASGSAQFSKNGLKTLLGRLKNAESVIIVDLRQESHGFANGIAISWYAPKDWGNVGKTQKEIEQDENRRLAELLKQKQVILHEVISKNADNTLKETAEIPLIVHQVANEAQMADFFKIGYFRICVTDHVRPSNQDVERFMDFVDHLKSDSWLHFHCSGGEGRTTAFLAMYDMMRNAKDVSFEDLIQRQYLLGGHNLAEMPEVNSWQYPLAAERLQFLRQFYEFCRTRSPGQKWIGN